jgi:mono/diheme cytochrome c family protein
VEPPKDHTNFVNFALFKPGDADFYTKSMAKIKAMGDGVDYSIYGYPSGVVGLRLFPNPDFFGTGAGPKKAREYWAAQVQANPDNYYTNSHINQDPKLVRPFRVGMSCGFCHIAPHPLNPPKDPEAPDWANLSTIIGNQFWKPQPAFAVLQDTNSFIHHFLSSQQPGTIDTSLVSSDQINNANTINAVFEVNARLARALLNPEERQSAENVRLRSIENQGRPILPGTNNFRNTPRVLLDGADSIGVFGALARVYLNIGTFYEEWSRCDNLFVGFKKQKPFLIEVCQSNSVYWQVNERYRAGYLADFFTMAYDPATNRHSYTGPNPPCKAPHTSTQSMKLMAAKDGDGQTPSMAAQSALALDAPEQRKHGRIVWLENCAICHSSKQPDGFTLSFKRKTGGEPWYSQPAPKDAHYVLPMDQADWVAFKNSPSYADYKTRVWQLAVQAKLLDGDPMTDHHPFWNENYLSTDIRVPLTLAGTPSGRAMASNGLKGHVWDNFSSITYKELPAVGAVAYFNPISATGATFEAPDGGRGYYRPATQVSLWATAPYLHNNALGVFLPDASVKGRLVQFFDGIRRVLWSSKRASPTLVLSDKEVKWLQQVQETEKGADSHSFYINTNMDTRREGDLRGISSAATNDDGFIYRLPNDTYVEFGPGFIHPLVEGVAGQFLTNFLTVGLWVALAILLLWLDWQRAPRQLGIVFIGLALLLLLPLALSGAGGGGSAIGMLLMSLATFLPFTIWGWAVIAAALVAAGVICIEAKPGGVWAARLVVATLLAGIGFGLLISEVIWPGLIVLVVALLAAFSLRWTLPELTRGFFILLTVADVIAGIAAHQFVNGRPIAFIPFTQVAMKPLPLKVGPIPLGTPVNLIMNIDPESPKLPHAVVSMTLALAEIKKKGLSKEAAWQLFSQRAGQALMDASTCPDFVLDRGHLFGETLDPDPKKNDQDKEDLIAFLKTL